MTTRRHPPDAMPEALRRALERESRRGLRIAAFARLIALAAVDLWLILVYPEPWSTFYHAIILLFALSAVAQIVLARREASARLVTVLIVIDGFLLALLLIAPNPLVEAAVPPALALRYDNFVFFFIFLGSTALSTSPGLVLLCGGASVLGWFVGIAWLVLLPETSTEFSLTYRELAATRGLVAAFLDPGHIHLASQVKQAFVLGVVTLLLALAAARARRVVRRQVLTERARTNLARHLPQTMVEALAGRDEPLGAVRRQTVAVLFADLKGFTALCENAPPESVIAWLRAFLGRMEHIVFAHGGTLDKFLGDGLMATFGTPEPAGDDAARALACARAMLAEADLLNVERHARGEPPLGLAIGLHVGPVVMGDVGSERRLEFAVLGDTVNVASRLEHLCRALEARLVVSADLVERLGDGREPSRDGLEPRDAVVVHGRTARVRVFVLRDDEACQPIPGDPSVDTGTPSSSPEPLR